MARGDFPRIIAGPVLEAGFEPRAACFAAVVLQGRRPQVGVVDVALRSVGEELALRPCGAGCWLEEGALFKGRLVRLDRPNPATKRMEKKKDNLP